MSCDSFRDQCLTTLVRLDGGLPSASLAKEFSLSAISDTTVDFKDATSVYSSAT